MILRFLNYSGGPIQWGRVTYPSIDLVQEVLNQDLAFRFLDKKRAADDLWHVVQQCQNDHDGKRQAQAHAPVEFIAHWLRSVFTQVPQMEALAERFCQVTDWISQESDPETRRSVRLAARLFPAGMLGVSVDIIRDILLGRPIDETMWKSYRQHVTHTTALAKLSAELQPAASLLERALSAPLRTPHDDIGDGACIPRVAHDFCWLEYRLGSASAMAVITSETSKGECRACAQAAEQISVNLWDDPLVVESTDGKFRMVELCRQVHQLLPGDVLLDDLKSDNGRLVFARGSELTRGAIKTLVTLAEYQDLPCDMRIRRKVLLDAACA